MDGEGLSITLSYGILIRNYSVIPFHDSPFGKSLEYWQGSSYV